MSNRVTIRDVARLADVSVATVSAVINKNKFVSDPLAERVMQAIAQLNYKPNLVARSLKMQETKTIGLIFTNTTSPIWPPLVRTAQQVTQQAGFDTFLVTTDEDVEREKMSLHSLLSKRIDGLLIAPAVSDSYEHIQEAALTLPVIAIERCVPGVESFITNNEIVSYQAVKHLIGHGYKRIGLVTIPVRASNTAERINGYSRALREHGLYDPVLIREVDFVGNTAFALALDLLTTTTVDAIFSTSQSTAMGALRAANHLGRRIPQDLALFGYDDVPWMEVVVAPLSTVCQPIEKIATLATQRLSECLEDGSRGSDAVHVVESGLVLRHSCGC
jgi:DNA-binding LacI/PurR family transcriptional regulator